MAPSSPRAPPLQSPVKSPTEAATQRPRAPAARPAAARSLRLKPIAVAAPPAPPSLVSAALPRLASLSPPPPPPPPSPPPARLRAVERPRADEAAAAVVASSAASGAGAGASAGDNKAARWRDPLASLPPRVKGLLLLNVLTLLFGTNVAVVKLAQESLGPWLFSAGRFSLAALAFSPFLPSALASPRTLRAGAELGLISAAGYASQAWGLQSTSASHTAFLGSFTVLLVPLFAGWAGRAIPGRTWAATGVALAGIAALELGGVSGGGGEAAGVVQMGGLQLAAGTVGDLASLFSAALFAVQMIRTEYHCSQLGGAAAPPLIATQLATLALLFGLAAAAGVSADPGASAALFSGDAMAVAQRLPLREFFLTGVVSTAGALWAELEAFRSVSAPDAALVYATEPVWGAVTAYFLLGERWAGSTWLGAALILAASVYGQQGEGEKASKAS